MTFKTIRNKGSGSKPNLDETIKLQLIITHYLRNIESFEKKPNGSLCKEVAVCFKISQWVNRKRNDG